MSYKITITETKTVEKEEQGSYTTLKQEYISRDKYDSLPFSEQKDWKESEGQYIKGIYGYPPLRLVSKEVETKIYEQTVEDLNITAVIEAVNWVDTK